MGQVCPMEVNNKTFAIFCVAVVAVTFYVRAQSVHTPVSTATEPVVTKAVAEKPTKRRGIPNSVMPPDLTASTDTQVTADDGTVATDGLPDGQPVAKTQSAVPQINEPINDDQDDVTYQDDVGNLYDANADTEQPQANDGWPISDRDTLRLMMRTMPPDQRDDFRVMWFTMTPDERGDFLDQVRGSLQGG